MRNYWGLNWRFKKILTINLDAVFLKAGSEMGCEVMILQSSVQLESLGWLTWLRIPSPLYPHIIRMLSFPPCALVERTTGSTRLVARVVQLYQSSLAIPNNSLSTPMIWLGICISRNPEKFIGKCTKIWVQDVYYRIESKNTKNVRTAFTHFFLLIDICMGAVQCNSKHPFKKMEAIYVLHTYENQQCSNTKCSIALIAWELLKVKM